MVVSRFFGTAPGGCVIPGMRLVGWRVDGLARVTGGSEMVTNFSHCRKRGSGG